MRTHALMQDLRARLGAPTRRAAGRLRSAGSTAFDVLCARPLLPRGSRADGPRPPADWPRLPAPPAPADASFLARLKQATVAQVGVGRAGVRLRTATYLEFLGNRAIAVEAVRSELPAGFAQQIRAAVEVHTEAADLDEFLLRPDLGRRLPQAELSRVVTGCARGVDVQVVVGDGLSARAVAMNAPAFLETFAAECGRLGFSVGDTVLVHKARVKVMDQIGEALGARLAVHLIGERPGLGTGDGMSAYMIYQPRAEAMDSDREVVSNIHERGIRPAEAGRQVAGMLAEFVRAGCSGVKRQSAPTPQLQTSAAARCAG
jgi:ethanolamine ammonia-lyase small subunit